MTTRRDFLISSAVVTGGMLVLTLDGCGGVDSETVQAELGNLLPDGAEKVGKAYRKAAPDDADPGGSLVSDLKSRGTDLRDSADVGRSLRELVADDFEKGRTVEVKQWVLSISECRLCALA